MTTYYGVCPNCSEIIESHDKKYDCICGYPDVELEGDESEVLLLAICPVCMCYEYIELKQENKNKAAICQHCQQYKRDDAALLFCNGTTIGNELSGGTARANADMEDLFFCLWSLFPDTEIEDRRGTTTTRGSTAQLDFDANKRLPLPDWRDRTNDISGGTIGAETHLPYEI